MKLSKEEERFISFPKTKKTKISCTRLQQKNMKKNIRSDSIMGFISFYGERAQRCLYMYREREGERRKERERMIERLVRLM